MTVTTAACFIPTLWADGVLDAVQYQEVFAKRVNRTFESELKYGTQLNIPRLSNLSVTTKSASTAIVPQAITEDAQELTISAFQYASFKIESIVAVQANQNLREHYERKIGYAIARATEVALAAQVASLTTNFVGTLGVELTVDDYLSAYQKLADAGVLEDTATPGADFSLILGPAAYVGLMKIDQFINRDYKGDGNAMESAKVGEILGFDVLRSSLVTANGGGHDCVMFHKEAFALMVQEDVPVQSQYDINHLADVVVGYRIYGKGIVKFPPEAGGGGTAVDNRAVWLKTV